MYVRAHAREKKEKVKSKEEKAICHSGLQPKTIFSNRISKILRIKHYLCTAYNLKLPIDYQTAMSLLYDKQTKNRITDLG